MIAARNGTRSRSIGARTVAGAVVGVHGCRRRARGSASRWPPRRASRSPRIAARVRAAIPRSSPAKERVAITEPAARDVRHRREVHVHAGARASCRPAAAAARRTLRAVPGTAGSRWGPRSPRSGCRRPPGPPSRARRPPAALLERAREARATRARSPPLRAEQDHARRLASRAAGAGCSRARRCRGSSRRDLAYLLAERERGPPARSAAATARSCACSAARSPLRRRRRPRQRTPGSGPPSRRAQRREPAPPGRPASGCGILSRIARPGSAPAGQPLNARRSGGWRAARAALAHHSGRALLRDSRLGAARRPARRARSRPPGRARRCP